MCHLASWVEVKTDKGKKELFITAKDTKSKRGAELRKYLGSRYDDDIIGHGAIDYFFDLNGKGVHKECTDFSTPDNLPSSIVNAIKAGDFAHVFSTDLLNMLTPKARKNLEDIPEYKAWDEAYDDADRAFNEACEALDEARKAWNEADKAYNEAYKAWDDADRARDEAYRARDEAYRARDEAYRARNIALRVSFWTVFADIKNRKKVWR